MEGGKIKTKTQLYVFADFDAKIYNILRKGVPVELVEDMFWQKLIRKQEVDGNLLLNEGIRFIWQAVTGASGLTYFNEANSYIGVGDSNAPADPGQTGLMGLNKWYKQVDAGYPQVSGNSIIFRATFGPDEANFSWNEWTVANGPTDYAVNLNRKAESLGNKAEGTTWIIQVSLTIS